MGRGKTVCKRIENTSQRNVTFSKRSKGILKKAKELAILCSAEVAVIIISPKGKLYEYSNKTVRATVERFWKAQRAKKGGKRADKRDNEHIYGEMENISRKFADLRGYRRRLVAEDVPDQYSQEEIGAIMSTAENAVRSIREVKDQHLTTLQQKNDLLSKENEELRQKFLSEKKSDDHRQGMVQELRIFGVTCQVQN